MCVCVCVYKLHIFSGNVTSFLVFLSRPFRQQSWSVYLASLSFSDTGFLVCLFFSWSNNIGLDVYHRNGWCQSLVYMTYIWSFLSVWYIVCFTVERYIVVKCPLKRLHICTAKRASIVVIFLSLFACILYSFAPWTSGLIPMHGRTEFCMPLEGYQDILSILIYIDTFITLILPTIIIVILNTLIICMVAQYHKNRRSLTNILSRQTTKANDSNSHDSVYVNVKGSNSARSQPKNNSVSHMTKMLVVVSTTFVLLNLPSHFFRIYNYLRVLCDPTYRTSHWQISLQKLLQYMYYLNFSINFLLYNVCGTQFRRSTIQMFRRLTSKCCPWSAEPKSRPTTSMPLISVGTPTKSSRYQNSERKEKHVQL